MLQTEPSLIYENSKTYSHVLIQGQSETYDEVIQKWNDAVENLKQNGIEDEIFERMKKKMYGEYVKSYNDVSSIATSFLQNYFREINPLDYFEEFKNLEKTYIMQILNQVFVPQKQVVSIVKPK